MGSKRLALLLLAVIIGLLWPSLVFAADAVTLTAEAEQLMQEQSFDEANELLTTVISDYPTAEKTWHARVKLAECYFYERKYDECIVEARKIVNVYPTSAPQVQAAWAQFYIGIACAEKHDIEAAKWELARVEQIVGQNPDRGPLIQARNKLALLYHDGNDRKMAAKTANEVIADDAVGANDKAWAYVILGSALVGDKKIDEGLQILNKVRKDYPQLQDHVLASERKIFDTNLGKHDYDGMITECRAILADPNASEARAKQAGKYLLLTLQYKKDYDKVLSETQVLMDRFAYSVEEQRSLLHNKGRTLAITKQYDKAIECLDAVLATNPTEPDFCALVEWDLAICYRLAGQQSLADQHVARIVELYPTSYMADRAAEKLQGK